VYFSGTGNTACIARVLQDEFIKQGSTCELMAMEELTLGRKNPDFSLYDLIGIGFPVHAMDAPQIVYDLPMLLPKGKKDYFLFKTAGSAMLQGGSTRKIREILANKAWHLKHEQLYVMPPNMFGTAKPGKVERYYSAAKELAAQSAHEILAGIRKRSPDTCLPGLCSSFARMEKHGSGKASKHWTVSMNCNLCGLCVAQCPRANIRIEDGKTVFGDNCLLCLRCWWNCPQRALSHRILKPFLLKEPSKLPE